MVFAGHLWTLTNQCSKLYSVEIEYRIHFEMTRSLWFFGACLKCGLVYFWVHQSLASYANGQLFTDTIQRGFIDLTEGRIKIPQTTLI